MRLIRWVEGRISGRKSRLKDGSTTSADDQFVYHPSPFRQPLSHIATPAHNQPPKLHHQLEQRLNEQIKERLSGHFPNEQLNAKINNSNKKQSGNLLRRTTSALESRSRFRKLINRTSNFNPIENRHSQYDAHYDLPYDGQLDKQFNAQSDPYSFPNNENSLINDNHQYNNYQNNYENEYLTEFENEIQRRQQNQNYQDNQNRYLSIADTSNESSFFDSSLAQDTPSLGKCGPDLNFIK